MRKWVGKKLEKMGKIRKNAKKSDENSQIPGKKLEKNGKNCTFLNPLAQMIETREASFELRKIGYE